MFFRKLNWNIVGWFRTVSLISYIVIALGLAAMIWHSTQAPGGGFQPSHALRLGLSFTGGTEVDVKFTKPVTTDQLKAVLQTVGAGESKVTTVTPKSAEPAGERYTIETQTAFGNNTGKIWDALGALAPVDRSSSQITSVGPSLGQEYLTKAVWALVIALAIQFLYIAFRFGWNYIFGLVTVIALARDAAMMIGIYALAGRRADDAFLAAVLTVIGYSVMDTIVILDRIRENTKLMAGVPYDRIVNTSILQTMTRSFNTLATVVITLVALLALGGASLQNFAFALLVGICSGGYHSIFFSAPLVLVFRKRQLEAAARKRRAGVASERLNSGRGAADAKTLASRGGVAREDIVAARKERRVKSKTVRPSDGPARYKRRREETGTATALEEPLIDERETMDPLDAENAGLHDQALEQGHEEVNLNLEGFELEHRPVVPDEHEQPHPPQS
ncbi:MAG: protein translocase subunit SecF [Candidatus Eremiobacteraeota bacterium]|nr:protein translocase subunit SecF [Candidatus Eremiobacteraeota bacterium]